jgi:thymidylate synthase (FAD)
VFYIRPVGFYVDREVHKYDFTPEWRARHLERAARSRLEYAEDILSGMAPEHARGLSCFDFRQNFCMTVNARSLMHILGMRSPADVQLECRALSFSLFYAFQKLMPEVAGYWKKEFFAKSRLTP